VTILKRCLFISGLLLLSLTNAYSAPPPDAGTLLREQQTPRKPLPDRLPETDETRTEPATQADTGATVLVKGFTFRGIDGMATEAELQALLQDAIGLKMDIKGLRQLATKVTAYLRSKGFFLARAWLPKQDVTSGMVQISVIGGRIEGIRMQIRDPHRISASTLNGIAGADLKKDLALREQQLERALMLMNDLPGITARATLERGKTYGTTNVLIDANEGPLLTGAISADNFGNRYTGAWRGTGSISVNDPLGIGDQLSLLLTGSEGLFQGRAAYSIPIGRSGLKGFVSYTGLYYELGKEYESLNAYGHANNIGAGLTYPIIRSRNFSLWSNLNYEYRMLDDFASGAISRDRDIHSGTFDLSANSYDRFGGGGLSSLRLAITAGDLKLGVAADAQTDAATAKSTGSYFKFNYTAARLQRIVNNLALFLSASGQLAGGNLDSSEKFILGGPNGIRSYPVGEGVGDEGHGLTAELRYDIPFKSVIGDLQLVGFFDTGNVTVHKDNNWANSVNSATGRNNYWLSASGLGFNLTKTARYALRATWAHAIDSNPGRSTSGKNADNYAEDNRFWLQATAWF